MTGITLRPIGEWTYEVKGENETAKAAAVLMTSVKLAGQNVEQPCEIRITEDDLRGLLKLKQIQKLVEEIKAEADRD